MMKEILPPKKKPPPRHPFEPRKTRPYKPPKRERPPEEKERRARFYDPVYLPYKRWRIEVKFQKRLRRYGPKASRSIQKVFRSHLDREFARGRRWGQMVGPRDRAARRVQALVRGIEGRERYVREKKRIEHATGMLQRVYRGFVSRRATRRIVASKTIQRYGRGMLARMEMRGRRAVREVQDAMMDDEWASELIGRLMLGYLARLRVRKLRNAAADNAHFATNIQRMRRGQMGRRKFVALKLIRFQEFLAITVIQRGVRRWMAMRRYRHKLMDSSRAIITVQVRV